MTNLTLPETNALTAKSGAVRDLLVRAASIVELSPESSAIAQSGLRVQDLLDRVSDDLELAVDLVVDSPEMLAEAEAIAARLAAVAADSGEIEKERKQLVGPLNDVVKLINAGYKAPREHVAGVLEPLKRKILAYHQEQRRLAAEREEAERRERERIAREAAEKEAAAVLEAQRAAAEASTAQGIVASAMIQEASARVDQARTEATQAVQALHTTVAAPAPKAKGVRGKWSAELVSLDNLILHVADRLRAGDRSLVGLLALDQSAANKKADLEQTGFNVPGLRAQFTESVSVRRATTV